jgi:hypothetical protein
MAFASRMAHGKRTLAPGRSNDRVHSRPLAVSLALAAYFAGCSAGPITSGGVHSSPTTTARMAPPAPAPPDAAAPHSSAVESESAWAPKLRQVTHAPYLLALDTDLDVASVTELLEAARHAGFDAVEIARGAEIAPINARARASGRPDELLFVVQGESWSLDWSAPAHGESVGSSFTNHIGTDAEGVASKWVDAPCQLSVAATADASFLAIVEGALAVSRGHRCIRGFAFGLYASPPRLDSTVWDRGPEPGRRARVLTLQLPPPPPIQHTPVVREQRDVRVGTGVEHWRILWRDPPLTSCMEGWGCICSAFGHSQHGQADLIRSRTGKPDETYSLSGIYDDGLDMPARGLSEAILPAWPSEKDDSEALDVKAIATAIQTRKMVTLMALHDYDHDGQATEFILPIGGVGCVFHHYVAVGLSKRNPQLHVLGTAKHPDAPLELSYAGWQTLERGAGTYVESHCGNHGSDEQIEIALRTGPDGIRGTTLTYACPREATHLLSQESW